MYTLVGVEPPIIKFWGSCDDHCARTEDVFLRLHLQKDRENLVLLSQALREREEQIEDLQQQLKQASRLAPQVFVRTEFVRTLLLCSIVCSNIAILYHMYFA
jgi:hypothetical protein